MMERKLTIDQLAKRSATKKNNRLRKKYPLLADQFAVTVEQEKERILKQRESAHKKFDDDTKKSIAMWNDGLKLREIAKKLLPREKFAERERVWQRWYGNRVPEHDGHRLKDFWWTSLHGTEYAFDHCPYKDRHSDPEWWIGYHVTFLARAEFAHCPTCGMPREIDLKKMNKAYNLKLWE